MTQIITIILKNNKQIEKSRTRFGINTTKIKPHINIVYPFELNEKIVEDIIKNSLKDVKKFHLTLKGLKKSAKGYYLYLLVNKGKAEIMKIYSRLHSSELSKFKNKDMPKYIPHLSLGNFKTKKEFDSAFKETKEKKLEFKSKVNSIQLVTLNKDYSIKKIKNFKLN